jgi:filamentous hemagglutinin
LGSQASNDLNLSARSRVRAGVDIVNQNLTLQNLTPDDVSVVRTDTGDFRASGQFEIKGPGRLLLQAGRNIDLAKLTDGLRATGNLNAAQLLTSDSARLTVVAGVKGNIDLTKMDGVYAEVVALNSASADIIDLYRQLGTEIDPAVVLGAADVNALAQRNTAYARFTKLDKNAPRALAAYQKSLKDGKLPLGPTADSLAATELYKLLNTEASVQKLKSVDSIAALAALPGGAAYGAYVDLDKRYPGLFADYVQRRGKGATPTGVTPIVFSNALAEVIAQAVPAGAVTGGNITSFDTVIKTEGGSDIDLWAPGGDITVGLTTPPKDKTIGVVTLAGGAIRSVLSGDFNINQGKTITGQGGDILLFSTAGSIDAGRGAKTSLSTPPPVRKPKLNSEGQQIGVELVSLAALQGSGIQTLTSDPDGLGPKETPKPGSIYLFAPAGAIDAGEAGIRSSGNIVLNAQTVLNASNISVAGSSAGVPVVAVGSIASALASGGGNNNTKPGEDAAKAAEKARAAAAEGLQKPTILTVEVLGFGDKNCKEQQKDCFGK